jgi:hypothetical protein
VRDAVAVVDPLLPHHVATQVLEPLRPHHVAPLSACVCGGACAVAVRAGARVW